MAVAGLHKASGLDSYLGNKERLTTRTSSIRKMWRDLENEGRVKENESLKTCGVVIGPESPCSSSLESVSMEIENECPQNQTQNQNQMVVLEKDGARKMFNEWGSKSFGGHTVYSSSRLNNECKRVRIVREWIESSTQQGDTGRTTGSEESTTPTGSQIDGSRSSIRRIYGRQALIDLLTKFVRERKREVDDLLENKFVSNFAHRHRIQALLKGRFLRNQRFVEDEKQIYVAATELGFLRQTNVVSDKRKGFLTRLNNNDGHVAQSDSDTSPGNEINNFDHAELAEDIVKEISHEINEKFEKTEFTPESPSAVGAMHDNNIMQYEETEKLPSTVDFSPRVDQSESSDSDTSSNIDTTYEHTRTNFTSTNPQERVNSNSDSDTSSDDDMKFDHVDHTEEIIHDIPNTSHNPQECAQAYSYSDMKFDHVDQTEETVHEIPNGSRNDDGGWYLETVGSEFQELHEEEWYANNNDNDNVGDRTESWFGGNSSYLEAALISRSNTFDWSDDDDNGSRVVELRELTSRRNVSSILQSDFGARLDRLMQSYVSRQDQSFESENEWMQDHDNGVEESPQTHGTGNLQGETGSEFLDSDYHLTVEHEIINELRIEMETLEQRMNGMQKMLEACMDMQIELQRSVQQEIHSALNRSSNSQDGTWNYESKSSTQNEDCFLCCDDESESLPNRFAHMLHICSKCAQKVNWSKLKESIRHP